MSTGATACSSLVSSSLDHSDAFWLQGRMKKYSEKFELVARKTTITTFQIIIIENLIQLWHKIWHNLLNLYKYACSSIHSQQREEDTICCLFRNHQVRYKKTQTQLIQNHELFTGCFFLFFAVKHVHHALLVLGCDGCDCCCWLTVMVGPGEGLDCLCSQIPASLTWSLRKTEEKEKIR